MHFVIALHHHGVLRAATEVADRGLNPGNLVSDYGRKFLPADATTALNYFMLAAGGLTWRFIHSGQAIGPSVCCHM